MSNIDSASVSKSRDPQWIRWAVTKAGQDTLWFYSKQDAKDYADAVDASDEDRQATMRLRTVQ